MSPEFEKPSWLNDQDAETIQRRMMEALPPDIDDTAGGFPYDFTMPTALEKAEMLEFHLMETLKIMFPQWAYSNWLDLHASVNAISRKPANPAYGVIQITGIPGTKIPAGMIFAVPAVGNTPAVEFITEGDATISNGGNVTVGVVAVEAGVKGNVAANTIKIMAMPIKGITDIGNMEATSGGTEAEDDDALRKRIIEVEQSGEINFVGCDADYVRWAMEVAGVGDAFVIANWNPDVPNSVKVVVMDANGDPANEHIIEDVVNHIMSPSDRMARKAPIGAIVTIVPPTPKYITYAFKATLRSGYTDQMVVQSFTASVKKYYSTAKAENVVQYNQIHAILTATPGVQDFTGLTMNGRTENIVLPDDEYPITKAVVPDTSMEVME